MFKNVIIIVFKIFFVLKYIKIIFFIFKIIFKISASIQNIQKLITLNKKIEFFKNTSLPAFRSK